MTGVALRRPAIFYGWYIVGVALVAQFISAGTSAYAAGVFLKPMTEDLGWSRGDFSAVQTVSTVVMGALGLFVGVQVDKRGPRPLMLAGGVISGASLILLSRVESLWQFYLIRGIGHTAGNALLGNLVVNVTVARWFVVRRGMAVSIASAGVSMGGVLMAPLASWWVEAYGWQTAWVLTGLLVWATIIPAAFVVRRSPEEAGMTPDGMSPEEAEAFAASHRRASAASEVQWTRAEAVRTRTIWLIILAYGVANIGLGAMLLHLFSFLTDQGYSRATAAGLFSVMSWSALISKAVWGALMDRFHARMLSAAGFALSGVSIIALLAVAGRSEALSIAVLALYGLGIGGMVPLQETVWASYFGRTHLGRIRSVAMPFSIVFGAGGPVLAGFLYDETGSYTLAFVLFAMFSAVGLVLILLARPPLRQERPDGLALPPEAGVAV
ncbi:MAG TPA: MFS transporter [Dehalococcoidia bacterium]|nr:MFS transporter [Dehalococcoidia bacterium]